MVLLVRLLEPGIDEAYQKYLELLKKEISAIQELVVSVVSPERRESVPIVSLIKELESQFIPKIQETGVRVVLETACASSSCLWCNPSSVLEAFYNVWENALEAMPGGGTLTIKAWEERPQDPPGRVLKVTFTDTGPGIPEPLISAVPRPFLSTKSGGLGLGLTISQAVAMAHGGSLDVVSGPQGTTIMFTFPLDSPPNFES